MFWKSISFTQFIKARSCKSSVVHPRMFLGRLVRFFYSRKQIVGFLYHEINERYLKEGLLSDFAKFEMFLRDFESKYSSKFDFNTCSNLSSWEEVSEIVGYLLKDENAQLQKRSDSKVYVENDFLTKDGIIYARPDLVIVNPHEVILYDYKSGKLVDDSGNLKENYIIQLHFYAAVIFESLGMFPEKGILESFFDGKRRLDLDKEYSLSLINNAKKIYQEVNEIFLADNMLENFKVNAVFDLDNCRFCNTRSVCLEYQKNENSYQDETIFCLSGELISCDQPSDNKFSTVQLICNGIKTFIYSVPEKYVRTLSQGQKLAFYDLKKNSESEFNFLSWSKIEIYE